MTIQTGGPAFPNEAYGNASPHTGMTLRDYFAGKVMQGMCSVTGINFGTKLDAAKLAYAMADAMLKAREQ